MDQAILKMNFCLKLQILYLPYLFRIQGMNKLFPLSTRTKFQVEVPSLITVNWTHIVNPHSWNPSEAVVEEAKKVTTFITSSIKLIIDRVDKYQKLLKCSIIIR